MNPLTDFSCGTLLLDHDKRQYKIPMYQLTHATGIFDILDVNVPPGEESTTLFHDDNPEAIRELLWLLYEPL